MKERTMSEGQRRYQEYWAREMADPEFQRAYEEEAANKEV